MGTTGTAAAPYDLGRTGTHEVGHYFNLDHVWGPGNGGCGQDDGVADTPLQSAPNYSCPSFPETDNCSGLPNGVMFSNYMDYVDDACMTIFTTGQKTRMLAALNGPRSSLLSSNGCAGVNNDDCPEDDITVSNIEQAEYKEVRNITSTATVANGSSVTFSATTSISLNPNFEVQQGGTFTAEIETCPEEN